MAEDIQTKLQNYRTAPFDSRFPNQNQTRNCFVNYMDYHRCQKSLDAKGVDTAPCDWYKRVYKSLCPMSWMAEDIQTKLQNYRTAPFDSRFPNQNQTRNCFVNYMDYHRCQKSLDAKGVDTAPCDWYKRVYKSLCPMSWIQKWDDQREEGIFPGKI